MIRIVYHYFPVDVDFYIEINVEQTACGIDSVSDMDSSGK